MSGDITRHRIRNFPFLRIRVPGDHCVHRAIFQFKPDGGDRVRHMEWLRQVKPEQFSAELSKIYSEQQI